VTAPRIAAQFTDAELVKGAPAAAPVHDSVVRVDGIDGKPDTDDREVRFESGKKITVMRAPKPKEDAPADRDYRDIRKAPDTGSTVIKPTHDVTGVKMRECQCLACGTPFKSMRGRDYCSGFLDKKTGKASGGCLKVLERDYHKLTCQNPGCERDGGTFYAKRADAIFCGNTCQKAAKRAPVRDNFQCKAA
jgi:hypothetical protein